MNATQPQNVTPEDGTEEARPEKKEKPSANGIFA
jgi:hypothetical protein